MQQTDVIRMFQQFDFDSDRDFQAGWYVIARQIDPSRRQLAFIQAKIFYFNKNVARLEFGEYMSWLKNKKKHLEQGPKKIPTPKENLDSCCTEKKLITESTNEFALNCLDDIKEAKNEAQGFSEYPSEGVKDSTRTSEKGIQSYVKQHLSEEHSLVMEDFKDDRVEGEHQLSFSQVADLIMNNKMIPGIKTINVQPTNAIPTPSVMIRKPKPWEITENI